MHRLSTVLCTSGLAAEAKIARAAGFPVVIGAGDRERTAALVESAVRHANCLMSFGIAGALAPHLRPGDVVISAEVVSVDHRWTTAGSFQTRVAALAQEIGAFEGAAVGRQQCKYALDGIHDVGPRRRQEHRFNAIPVQFEHREQQILLSGEKVIQAA